MASTATMDPSTPSTPPARARDVANDDDAVSTVRKSLTKSGGVCTPFDARRATCAAGISLSFEDVTSLMRRARVDDDVGPQTRRVDVSRFVDALRAATATRRDARDGVEPASSSDRPNTSALARDPLVELARELLPGYGAEEETTTTRSSKAVQLGRELERRSDRLTRLEESLARAKRETNHLVAAKDEALESKAARMAALQIEMEMLRVSVEDARRETADARRRAFDAENRVRELEIEMDAEEKRSRESVLECMIKLHQVESRMESLKVENARLSDELSHARTLVEKAATAEINLETRLKSLRNGDLLVALRERVIECQNELRNERLASDLAKKRHNRQLLKTERFVMRLRDKARKLGICIEMLDVPSSESDDE